MNNQIEFIESIVRTDTSFLNTYIFTNEDLLHMCIEDVKNELLENPTLQIYGKTAIHHRSIGFFSDNSIGYYYSGQLAKSKPLSSNLLSLLTIINAHFAMEYNGILVNKYGDGNDCIGAHSDDEKGLDVGGVIAISCGAIRKFRVRNKISKKIVIDIPTISNHILHMGGDFQKEFTHEIPIEKKVKDIRYSFTFRKHLR